MRVGDLVPKMENWVGEFGDMGVVVVVVDRWRTAAVSVVSVEKSSGEESKVVVQVEAVVYLKIGANLCPEVWQINGWMILGILAGEEMEERVLVRVRSLRQEVESLFVEFILFQSRCFVQCVCFISYMGIID